MIGREPPCRWCGELFAVHLDGRDPDSPVPRMPCTGLKFNFQPATVYDVECDCGKVQAIAYDRTFTTCPACGRVHRFDGKQWGPGEPPADAEEYSTGALGTPFRKPFAGGNGGVS